MRIWKVESAIQPIALFKKGYIMLWRILIATITIFFFQPLSLVVAADSFSNANQSVIDYQKVVSSPAQSCRTLISSSNPKWSVLKSELIAKREDIPEYCLVIGVIPSEIKFELLLPTNWNGRFYMLGNGGLAGTPPQESRPRLEVATRYGFAAAFTDTGHDNRTHPGGTFAYQNLDKLIDFGFRAVKLTNNTSKELIHQYYNESVAYSYFDGCSTGGRQGMISAQRFPSDFDGIIAGAPAHNYTGLKFSQAWRASALKDVSLSESDVESLATYIYKRCDSIDGINDGIINDPRRCDFDPDKHLPRCDKGNNQNCFSEAKIAALKRIYSVVKVADHEVYPAFPVGSEVSVPNSHGQVKPGWVPWLVNDSGPSIFNASLGSDVFRYMMFTRDDPQLKLVDIDFNTEPDNLEYLSSIVDAVDPDLSEFMKSGGKLISYIGWADPDINPLSMIDYYRDVTQKMQGVKIDNFFKLYMMPGVFHCNGGPGGGEFDFMTPLINWVEGDSEPSSLALIQNFPEGYTRILCPYPRIPFVDTNNSGSVNANVTCIIEQTDMATLF